MPNFHALEKHIEAHPSCAKCMLRNNARPVQNVMKVLHPPVRLDHTFEDVLPRVVEHTTLLDCDDKTTKEAFKRHKKQLRMRFKHDLRRQAFRKIMHLQVRQESACTILKIEKTADAAEVEAATRALSVKLNPQGLPKDLATTHRALLGQVNRASQLALLEIDQREQEQKTRKGLTRSNDDHLSDTQSATSGQEDLPATNIRRVGLRLSIRPTRSKLS